jgi:hypothetical protein
VLQALRDHHNSTFPAKATLRNFFQAAGPVQPSSVYAWMPLLATAALALPPECFAQALESWRLPEQKDWNAQQWQRELGKFTETIGIRQRLMEEIPL